MLEQQEPLCRSSATLAACRCLMAAKLPQGQRGAEDLDPVEPVSRCPAQMQRSWMGPLGYTKSSLCHKHPTRQCFHKYINFHLILELFFFFFGSLRTCPYRSYLQLKIGSSWTRHLQKCATLPCGRMPQRRPACPPSFFRVASIGCIPGS